jgi:hypothetical protein
MGALKKSEKMREIPGVSEKMKRAGKLAAPTGFEPVYPD